MSDKQHFEAMLRHRHFEPTRADLAQRIITRARLVPQSRIGRIAEIFSAFVLPKPAFALAATLLIGAAIGISLPAQRGDDEFSMQSYLDDNGAVL